MNRHMHTHTNHYAGKKFIKPLLKQKYFGMFQMTGGLSVCMRNKEQEQMNTI